MAVNRKTRLAALFLMPLCATTLLLAAGCSAKNGNIINTNASPPTDVTGLIAESAKLIHDDLMQLNRLREANSPIMGEPHRSIPKSGPLAKKVTLAWSGPAHEPVKFVTDLMGWKFRVTGAKPADPLYVTVNAVNQSAYQVLDDIGTQMGARGSLYIEADRELIVVEYQPEYERDTDGATDGNIFWHGGKAKRHHPASRHWHGRKTNAHGKNHHYRKINK